MLKSWYELLLISFDYLPAKILHSVSGSVLMLQRELEKLGLIRLNWKSLSIIFDTVSSVLSQASNISSPEIGKGLSINAGLDANVRTKT